MRNNYLNLSILLKRSLVLVLVALLPVLSHAQNMLAPVLSTTIMCAGSTQQIDFSATGNYGGAVFTAELSDASGQFTSPVNIGSETLPPSATNPVGSIYATIPANTTAGTGYRIRVVSNSPAVTSPDNGADITVNEKPVMNTIFNSGGCNGNTITIANFGSNISGTTYAWTNSNTSIGLAASGNGNITSFNGTNTSNSDLYGVIVVTPTANGCTGQPKIFLMTVFPTPTVNAVAGQSICNGANTTQVNFSGDVTGTVYNWTNNTTSIGLAASGAGNISAFAAVNAGTAPVTATVTVTPVRSGCTGTSTTFDITANPIPVINTITNQAVCNGVTTTTTSFGSTPGGATYTWTNNTTSIGLAASGSGNVNAFTGINTGTAPVTATIAVTPTIGGCAGSPVSFDITVEPSPVVTVADQPACNGITKTINFTSTLAGTSYAWTNSETASGLAASGTGDISFTATNPNISPLVTNVVVTPTANSCTGVNDTFSISVYPVVTPAVNIGTTTGTSICPGVAVSFSAIPTSGAGVYPTYEWKLNGNIVGNATAGYTNTGTLQNGDVISVIMTSNAPCPANPTAANNVTMTVVPFTVPAVTIAANPGNSFCSGTSVTLTATPSNGGVAPKYQWKNNGVNVGANSATYTTTGLNNFDIVTCNITSDAFCPATTASNAIAMNVTPTLAPAVTITANPGSPTCQGTAIFFNAVPLAGGTNPSFQWKVDGINVGTNSTSYTDLGNLSSGAHTITCVLTSNYVCRSQATGTGTLNHTVSPMTTPTVSIASSSAPNGNVCAGASVTFTATATSPGGSPIYKWKKNGVDLGISTATYAAGTTLSTGDVITCELTSNATCILTNNATSNAVTITVWPNVTTTVTVAATTPVQWHCNSLPVNFTATAVNAGPSPAYQWKKNGVNVGTNSATYTDATLATGNTISCVVTPNIPCALPNPVTSNTVTMTMGTISAAVANIYVSLDSVACEGTPMVFSSYHTNGGSNPSYKWLLNGTFIPGATQPTFSSNNLADGDKVACQLISSANCVYPIMSNTIGAHITQISVPEVEIGGYPDAAGITFYSTVTHGGTAPTYQWRKNGVDIPGATNPTYHSIDHKQTDKITLFVHSSEACAMPEFVLSEPLQPMKVTSVKEMSTGINDLSLFPNPNSGVFTITGTIQQPAKDADVEILNAVGQVVYRERMPVNGSVIDLKINMGGNATPGTYMMRLNVDGHTTALRFVLN